jgi:hypothetical protein
MSSENFSGTIKIAVPENVSLEQENSQFEKQETEDNLYRDDSTFIQMC